TQVRMEFDRFKRILLEVGELRIKPRLSLSQAADYSIESDSEVLSVALWQKSGQGFDRVYAGINPKFAGGSLATMDVLAAVLSRESVDRPLILPAFKGQSRVYAGSLPDAGNTGAIAMLVVPFGSTPGKSEVSEVLAAWISLEKLQRLFTADGLVQSELV